ncbi:MAG: pyridoxal-phosphate dependent enzyme, partial [Cyclobacteriaceae bacterium]|nr:pyridoxal-phosphate dependent enzyme [Cyclobacteriaceae bacterium]
MESAIPQRKDLEEAKRRIEGKVNKTPVFTSQTMNDLIGGEVFFKCENLQKVGAFKARGGMNAVFSLSEEERARGVATHSSGNHAQAVALAAKKAGIPAYIVMPETAPEVKVQAVQGYGGEIIRCKPNQAARESTLQEVVDRTGAEFIHPYDDYRIICGQATAAMELLEEVTGLSALITPVGGGGLLSGTILARNYFSPETQVYAGEPTGADDAFRSIRDNTIHPSESPKTIADGLLTSLGKKNFEIIREGIKEIITVSDREIIEAMKLLWERMKIVVEPSGAVPLAAVIKKKELFQNRRTGIILSGGNIDLAKFWE